MMKNHLPVVNEASQLAIRHCQAHIKHLLWSREKCSKWQRGRKTKDHATRRETAEEKLSKQQKQMTKEVCSVVAKLMMRKWVMHPSETFHLHAR